MKKILSLALLLMLVVSMGGIVSASTLITGKIYTEGYKDVIDGADVIITCVHNGNVNVKNTTSSDGGKYAFKFSETGSDGCNGGDSVKIEGTYGSLYGWQNATVTNDFVGDLDLAILNVPLVPEFGFLIGMVTMISAVTVFFVIRKN